MPPGKLADANALLGVAQSVTRVIAPALAGVLIGLTQPTVVVAVDAAAFGVSLVALAVLNVPPTASAMRSPWRDLADGWQQFRMQTWLWPTTVQFALFNLLTWAPFLLIGPILARKYMGGARAWRSIVVAMALGSVVAGLALLRRRRRRPLVIAVIGSYGYAAPACCCPCICPSMRSLLEPVRRAWARQCSAPIGRR